MLFGLAPSLSFSCFFLSRMHTDAVENWQAIAINIKREGERDTERVAYCIMMRCVISRRLLIEMQWFFVASVAVRFARFSEGWAMRIVYRDGGRLFFMLDFEWNVIGSCLPIEFHFEVNSSEALLVLVFSNAEGMEINITDTNFDFTQYWKSNNGINSTVYKYYFFSSK